jgi:hypothetical protein
MKTLRDILITLGGLIVAVCTFIYTIGEVSPAFKRIALALVVVGVVLVLGGIVLFLTTKEGLRSFIVLSKAELLKPMVSGTVPVARITIHNTGQVPADNLRVSVGGELLGGEERKKAQKGKLPQGKLIDTDPAESLDAGKKGVFGSLPASASISGSDISSVDQDTLTFYAWGEVVYDDLYGKDRSCKFCAFTNDINSTKLTRCSKGNVAH